MPEALILCGSADPEGVTRAMCVSARSHLEAMGYSSELMVLSDLGISHCTDCGGCSSGRCVIDDGMGEVYRRFASADLLVLASPIHFSGPSSIIKTAMDRFQMYWFDRTLAHPSRCVALLCGGSPEPRFSFTVSIFRAFCITTGMVWSGHLEVPDTDSRGGEGVDDAVGAFLADVIGP